MEKHNLPKVKTILRKILNGKPVCQFTWHLLSASIPTHLQCISANNLQSLLSKIGNVSFKTCSRVTKTTEGSTPSRM